MEGSEIFFTMTECPLTAVATPLDLIWLSRKSFEIALETVPESTIIESTTMSEASGSNPRCAPSPCPPFFFSSTALTLAAPAIAQLERGNLLFAYVLVERVRTHSQILRSLANIHHLS